MNGTIEVDTLVFSFFNSLDFALSTHCESVVFVWFLPAFLHLPHATWNLPHATWRV